MPLPMRPLVCLGILMSLVFVPTRSTIRGQGVSGAVTYAAGWNLVGGSPGADLTGALGSLYTLEADDSVYSSVPSGSVRTRDTLGTPGPVAGVGYWAFFATLTTVASPLVYPPLNPGGGGTASYFSIFAPAGRWIMIGNPYGRSVAILGADAAVAYDAAAGRYLSISVLEPGLGAFAYSADGGAILLCPVDKRCQ